MGTHSKPNEPTPPPQPPQRDDGVNPDVQRDGDGTRRKPK